LAGWLVRWLVCPHITSKTDYVAIPSRLGFGDLLVQEEEDEAWAACVGKYTMQGNLFALLQTENESVPPFSPIPFFITQFNMFNTCFIV
jgi:hypothetical protein